MRPKEQIQQEYGRLCAQAGDMQYKITCFQGELATINNKLMALNKEAMELQNGETNQGTTTEQTQSETSLPASGSVDTGSAEH